MMLQVSTPKDELVRRNAVLETSEETTAIFLEITNAMNINNITSFHQFLITEILTSSEYTGTTAMGDGGNKYLCNAGKLLPVYRALQPRGQPSSHSPPLELQILRDLSSLVLIKLRRSFSVEGDL
jgi:hypothetical protein